MSDRAESLATSLEAGAALDLARTIASGTPVAGLSWESVADLNGQHAREHAGVAKAAALALLP